MRQELRVGDRPIGDGHPVFIIAEAGINHNGDLAHARQLVDIACEAGADAVKFQTHFPALEMLREGPSADYVGGSFFDLLDRTKLSPEDHVELQAYARRAGIIFLSTPFSREAATFLADLGVAAFKIGSGEMTNLPLLEVVARLRRPMLVSTGMSSWEEVVRSHDLLRALGVPFALLHCVSSYPTRYADLNLRVIERMRRAFAVPVGVSDHSLGIYTALAAIPLGACVVEKHFTVSRAWPGPDQQASLEPAELRELVAGVRAIEEALGDTKAVAAAEWPVREMAFESVVTTAPVRRGEPFTPDNLWVKRPGSGIPAHRFHELLGRRAAVDIAADSLVRWDLVQDG